MADVINFEDYTDEELEAPEAAPEAAPEGSNKQVRAYMDFDNFWSEKVQEVIKIRLYGEDHELPASVPAEIVLGILRMQAEGIKEVPDEKVLLMTESIFGTERLAAWCAKGMTVDQMGDLLSWALDQYQSMRPMGNLKAKQGKVKRGKQNR